MPESVAVTGGNGRVGQHVLEHLTAQGYRTINLSRGKREEDHSDAYVRTDLLDAGEVYGALAQSDADAVVHLGMIPTPDHTPGYRTYESNVLSSYHVLEAAGELGIDRVTLASSFSAIGGGFEPEPITVDYLPVDEDHRLTPSNPYAMGKQVLEVTADGFARRSADAPGTITSLRFPWVVDDDTAQKTFVEADRTLAGLRNSDHFHTQRNTLCGYVHATDAVTLVEAAIEASFDGHERLWVSAPDTSAETPSAELATELYPEADYRGPAADDENPYTALIDTSKAEQLLDWEPTWSWRQLV
ncbi:NAD-dependent epimerase/dehydratase family protein [Haloarcula argentinensis]|uniref:NAD(P)-dependent oxidoreductase n=1 Tax=Haloarcula argentinensis TaxID=43776 RepID=A0A830FFC3_HALAR|nr:NAD(P)-dependent oxidoreductase [Haloarcula argentinensis]EMA19654.1 UDP-glucose 4-epimerase [Haloarcula argentinensis DSM 12282]MDS0254517.1 NAD(P)-dependent oxidoreductase [Haloarcula argentinensis]GGM41117.1 NAD-dependent epimerase [Haloarcula argentinensis]